MSPIVHFIYSRCLCSDLFVSLPGRDDVAALYQRGTIHTTVHLIGRVVQALESFDTSKLSQYSHLYRAFDMHTASFIKPDDLLEFEIRILVPYSKRWKSMKTPPRNGSIIGVHGVLLGYDSSAKRILLSLQDIDYIPQDDKSASVETSWISFVHATSALLKLLGGFCGTIL